MSSYALGAGFNRESGTVTDSGSDLTFTDDLGQWNGSIYTCAINGYYDVEFVGKLFVQYKNDSDNVEWKANSLEYNYKMELVKNNGNVVTLASSSGTQLITPSDGASHSSPWTDFLNPLEMSMNASNVAMEPGDKIRIVVGHRHPGYVNWAGNDSNVWSRLVLDPVYDGAFSKFIVEPASNILMGNEAIDMNQILDKKIKMKEFFLDIVKMFNLVIQDNPNVTNDIIIEPRDDFFKSRQRVLNWDEELKLDNDSDVKITPMSELDFKSYRYTYAADTDYYNKEYTDETNRVYGDYEIQVDNDFSDKENKLELMFASTPNGQPFIDSRVAPFFADLEGGTTMKPKKVKPRILFYTGLKDGQFVLQNNPNATSSTVFPQYPYCGMWDDPYDPEYDLAFGKPQKIYWNSPVFPNNNLVQMWWSSTISELSDVNAKLLEANFYLTPIDIQDFDFRDIILINNVYCVCYDLGQTFISICWYFVCL